MAIAFNPPVAPQVGSSSETVWETHEAKTEDGYSQRAPRGTSYERETAHLEWPLLTNADADTIKATLASAYGVVIINYAVPPSSTSKQWVCKRVSRQELDPLNSSLSATFEEVFDP